MYDKTTDIVFVDIAFYKECLKMTLM